jgi:hypothetical protein
MPAPASSSPAVAGPCACSAGVEAEPIAEVQRQHVDGAEHGCEPVLGEVVGPHEVLRRSVAREGLLGIRLTFWAVVPPQNVRVTSIC